MKELGQFRRAFPEQGILPGFQSLLGLPPGVEKVGPSAEDLLMIIRQGAEMTGRLPISPDSVLALAGNRMYPWDSTIGKFLDSVANGNYDCPEGSKGI